MMKTSRILILGTLGMVALSSCSRDEVIEINKDGNEIRFGAVAENATKAENVFCSNNLPGKFNVWAKHEGKTYISGDEIEHKGNKWENNSGVRYWPNTGAVDFYAIVNGDLTWDLTAPKVENFTVNADVAAQKDLLYSVKAGEAKKDGDVKMNFRHALSQIVFRAKNTNKNLYVEIDGVKVVNVGDKNTFTYPSKSTDATIVDHNSVNTGAITYDDTWGRWDELKSGTASYEVRLGAAVPVNGNGEYVDLTTKNDTGKEYNAKAMLLLPQTTTKCDIKAAEKPYATGSYFMVSCRIFNVAGERVDLASDVCLWGEKVTDLTYSTKYLAIPASFNWEQGKKYIYTFVFGKGNGGYTPDPDDPEPVLVPITFDITVDDFTAVSDTEIESGID